jgi:hypothetical protein
MKIFVQIASYRDPELVKTIEDILDKAKKPKNLVFAIARQYADEDGFDKLGDLPVVIDENLIYKGDEFSFDKKVKFTLLDIMTCIFEEVIYTVKEGKNIEA